MWSEVNSESWKSLLRVPVPEYKSESKLKQFLNSNRVSEDGCAELSESFGWGLFCWFPPSPTPPTPQISLLDIQINCLALWLVSECSSLGSSSYSWPKLLLYIVQRQYSLGIHWNGRNGFLPLPGADQKSTIRWMKLLQIKLIFLTPFPCFGFREFRDELCKSVCMSGSYYF